MSPLSLQAIRFIEQALAFAGNTRSQAEWKGWVRLSNPEITPHIAHVAIQALSGMALHIDERLDQADVSSAEAARL